MNTFRLSAGLVSLLGFCTRANAQSDIGGNVDLDAQAKNVISAAIGSKTDSNVSLSSVENSRFRGDVNTESKVKNVISAAIGNTAKSDVAIASASNSIVGGKTSEISSGRDDSRDPYTLISSLHHANQHMTFAARSEDTSQNMLYSAEDFATNIEALYARGSTMLDVIDIYETSDGAGKLQSVKAMQQLAKQILDGEDFNQNNDIGDVKGEHGLRQIRDNLAAAATREVPSYTPVSRRYLFGVVRLPNGQWKFRDANSTGSYSRTY